MPRLMIWWSVVLCLIAGASVLRYDARYAYASTNSGAEIGQRVESVLANNDFTTIGNAVDHQGAQVANALAFQDGICTRPFVVAHFPITKLARAYAEDFKPYGDAARFYYRDVAYPDSARVTLTLRWLKSLVVGTVTGRDGAGLRDQIMVLWPEGCTEPKVDWRPVWDGQERSNGL